MPRFVCVWGVEGVCDRVDLLINTKRPTNTKPLTSLYQDRVIEKPVYVIVEKVVEKIVEVPVEVFVPVIEYVIKEVRAYIISHIVYVCIILSNHVAH